MTFSIQVADTRRMTHRAPPRPTELFADLFRTHYPRLLSYVTRLCGEPDLAADIVQEAFVRLHAQPRPLKMPVPWLITVATNLLRNTRTRSTRRAELAAMAVDDTPEDRDLVVLREEQARVRAALGTLMPRDQQLLTLLACGYSYREMSQALGIHETSVGTLLSRAKRAFRLAYGGRDDTP